MLRPRSQRFFTTLLGIAALLFVLALPLRAGHIDYPIKWSQPIGWVVNPGQPTSIYGLDRPSNHGEQILADDFISNGLPIVAVRWWGSYLQAPYEESPVGFVVPFDISFHASVPGPPPSPHPFSLPLVGTPLSLQQVLAQEHLVGLDASGNAVYEYNAFLPTPFPEVAGTEYFIDIDRYLPLEPVNWRWGWHDAAPGQPPPTLDWAATAAGHNGPWTTYNIGATAPVYTELAFELMTNIPEPASAALLLIGGSALLALGRFRRRT